LETEIFRLEIFGLEKSDAVPIVFLAEQRASGFSKPLRNAGVLWKLSRVYPAMFVL
jgi:hypothetical protein